MVFLGLGIAMVVMDATIVNVALPSIIADLDITSIDAEWVNAIYALVFAALLIVAGRLGDRVGRRRIFVAGAAVFAGASLLAALSPSGEALIAARALQGVGGAMISPSSLSLVNATYSGRARTVAFAIYGSLIGGMAAVGPLLGGWLTENFSWQWAFLINLPLGVVVIVGALLRIPDSKDDDIAPGVDVVGAVLSAVGIGLLVFGLIEGRNYGWWRTDGAVSIAGGEWPVGAISPVFVAFVLSVAALVSLSVVEQRRTAAGRSALIDFSLFRIPTFGLGSLAALIVSLGEFGILFSLPLFLQSVQGYSAFGAGGVLAALAAGSFVSGPTSARIADLRSPRFVARLGLGLEVIGIVGLGLVVSPAVSGWVVAGWLFIYGIGVGYASAQLTGLILADVPVRQSGQASGTQSTARQLGSALGTAVLGTVLFVSLVDRTDANLQGVPGLSQEQISAIGTAVEQSAGTVIPSLAEQPGGQVVADAAGQAFAESIQTTAFVAAGAVGVGLLATLWLPPEARREDDD